MSHHDLCEDEEYGMEWQHLAHTSSGAHREACKSAAYPVLDLVSKSVCLLSGLLVCLRLSFELYFSSLVFPI